jgi:dipeptidyl aminopeptidase/acylaminoacyl peptidase
VDEVRRRLWIAALTPALVATVVACGSRRTVARIVFVRQGDIYVIGADGSELTALTYSAAEERLPRWSPDGKQIVFVRTIDGRGQLYLMNADGSKIRALVRSRYDDSGPSWSPDGRSIVFSRLLSADCLDCPTAIERVALATGAVRRLTTGPSDNADFPAWSPDGTKIVFGSSGLEMITPAGGRPSFVQTRPAAVAQPRWSPDGTELAYQLDGQIGVMRSGGGARRGRTLTNADDNEDPAWSPSGNELAFTRRLQPAELATPAIYIVSIHGGAARRLIEGMEPDWTAAAPAGASSTPTTAATYRASARGYCTTLAVHIGELPRTTHPRQAARDRLDVIQQFLDALRRMTPPSKVAAMHAQLLGTTEKLQGWYRSIAGAGGVTSNEVRREARLVVRLSAIWKKLGVDRCASLFSS